MDWRALLNCGASSALGSDAVSCRIQLSTAHPAREKMCRDHCSRRMRLEWKRWRWAAVTIRRFTRPIKRGEKLNRVNHSPRAATSPAKNRGTAHHRRFSSEGGRAATRDNLHADRLAIEMQRVDRHATLPPEFWRKRAARFRSKILPVRAIIGLPLE